MWIHLEGKRIADVRIFYGGMAVIPKRALFAEQKLRGNNWNEATINQAVKTIQRNYSPLSDLRASQTYRQRVAANLLKRFYYEIRGEPNTSVWRYAG